MRIETLVEQTKIVGFVCALGVLLTTATVHAQSAPVCSAVDPDDCDVVTFIGMSTGNHGTTFTENGFTFTIFNNQNTQYSVTDQRNLRHVLGLGCNSNEIVLPAPREYVTLLFKGSPAEINVLALDSGGTVVDEATKSNSTAPDGAEAVKLGPTESLIKTVIVHCVDGCTLSANDAYISEIRACNISAN